MPGSRSRWSLDAGVEVKMESGTYACGFCSESVRGTAGPKCSQCSAHPVHWACVAGTKYAGQCATCDGETMEAWNDTSAGTAAPSDIIDLTDQETEGVGLTEVAALTEKRAREDAAPALAQARRLMAAVRRRVRVVMLLAAAPRARSAQTLAREGLVGSSAAGWAADQEAGKADQGAQVAQAAGGLRRVREERAVVSGQRQTETRGGEAGEGSEHEGQIRGDVSTIEEGASARSAEGGASASTTE